LHEVGGFSNGIDALAVAMAFGDSGKTKSATFLYTTLSTYHVGFEFWGEWSMLNESKELHAAEIDWKKQI
jgi:hypothetical protein